MYIRQIIICAFVIFGFALQLQAQINCKVVKYTSEHGLSHDRITNILQDQDGFMWIASWGGISRFDGRNFISFKANPTDGTILMNSRIEKLVDDRAGNLWLRGVDQKLYRFYKKKERFAVVKGIDFPKNVNIKDIVCLSPGLIAMTLKGAGVYLISANGNQPKITAFNKKQTGVGQLQSDSVRFVFADQSNQIWMGTTKGVVGLKKDKNGTYRQITIANKAALAKHYFTNYEEGASQVYFVTTKGELVAIDKNNYHATTHKITNSTIKGITKSKKTNVLYCTTENGSIVAFNSETKQFATTKIEDGEPILSAFEDRSGNLWLELMYKGVIRYVPSTGKITRFNSREDGANNGLNKYNIFEDDQGRVWVNIKGSGFGYYDPKRNLISSVYTAGGQNATGHFPEMVNNTTYDRFGVIWLATHDGIFKIVPSNTNFDPQLVNHDSNRLANEVRGLTTDRLGRTWVGTKAGDVHLYQNGTVQHQVFKNKPKGGFGMVYAILEDHKGTIWIGTKRNGLFKADPIDAERKTYQLTHFMPKSANASGLNSDEIVALFEDHKNRIWIGTFNKGISLAAEKNGKMEFVPIAQNLKGMEQYQRIRNFNADVYNNLWIGTTEGLVVLQLSSDLKNPKIRTYGNVEGAQSNLDFSDVQHILAYNKGEMWLSTTGGGLTQATFKDPLKEITFKNYNKENGLPSNYVLSAQKDRLGKIWVATQAGLSRFDPFKNTFRTYGENDGVFLSAFAEAAVTTAPNGELTFGTEKGFLTFDPARLNERPRNAKIAFQSLEVNNRLVTPSDTGSVLQNWINQTTNIQLKHDQNTVSIDFGMLDSRNGLKQPMLYRLKGFDRGWKQSDRQHQATYTNLPPGDYVFEVRNLKGEIYQEETSRALAITVLPPFWRTWWAYLIYMLAFSALIVIVLRTARTILQLRQSVAVEREVAALKVDFFTQVSHELRTPLTLILNPIKAIMESEKLSIKGSHYIQLIYRNAARLTRFMDQWLDLRKIQSGKGELRYQTVEIVGFTRKLADYFRGAGTDKNISFAIRSALDELYVQIDAEKVDVMIYNLLSNAYKFSKAAGVVEIVIGQPDNDGNFNLAISDEGIGLPTEKLEEVFLLYHVDNRKETTAIKGTGIGLALVKEIVELHHGKVKASNNKNGGLTVEVTLPVSANIAEHEVAQELMPDNVTSGLGLVGEQEVVVEEPVNSSYPVLLLVEDSYELRSFLSRELASHFQVICESDGLAGFLAATQMLPDLILSDVMMPVMDGIEMLDKLKNDQRTSHIPVVLLTAKSSIESQLEGLRYGADNYFTKPFQKELLVAAMQNLIRQRKMIFGAIKDKVIDLSPGQIAITSRDEAFLKKVIHIVETSMSDSDFTIEVLADHMAMGRTTFYSKFKSLTGTTAVDFVRDMRLIRAKQLFDAGEERISTVAFDVGFNHPKYFSTCFKEKYGASPSEYLKSLTKQ